MSRPSLESKPLKRVPQLYTHRGVPIYVERTVRQALRRAATLIAVHHRLTVHLVPAPTITASMRWGGWGWACYVPAMQRIYIAGHAPRVWKRDSGLSHREAVSELRNAVLHELVHYEQWRNGVEPHHFGIEQRVTALMRRAGYWVNP